MDKGVITDLSCVVGLILAGSLIMEKENQICIANNILNTSTDDFQPPRPIKKKRKVGSERFGSVTSEVEISEITKGYTPANTKRSTNWALGVFNDWKASTDSCHSNLLENHVVGEPDT